MSVMDSTRRFGAMPATGMTARARSWLSSSHPIPRCYPRRVPTLTHLSREDARGVELNMTRATYVTRLVNEIGAMNYAAGALPSTA